MDQKKSGVQPASPWFGSAPGLKPSAAKKPESKPSKSFAIPGNIMVIAGVVILLVVGFLFFIFITSKDRLWAFEDNLNAAVQKMSSSTIGTVKAVVIPLPESVDQVCFTNYNSGSEYGVEVSMQPEKLDRFNVPNLYSVEQSSLCVSTAGSLNVRMQYLSKDGLAFVALYLSSIDKGISPFSSTPPPETPPANESQPPVNESEPPASGLSELQVAACESAASNNNCGRLAELGIVSAAECCSEVSLCC